MDMLSIDKSYNTNILVFFKDMKFDKDLILVRIKV